MSHSGGANIHETIEISVLDISYSELIRFVLQTNCINRYKYIYIYSIYIYVSITMIHLIMFQIELHSIHQCKTDKLLSKSDRSIDRLDQLIQ